MGIISNLFGNEHRQWPPDDDRWYQSISGGASTVSGSRVNEFSAMAYSAVYACVRLIAEAISTLPLHLYRTTDNGKERAKQNPMYSLLHDSPNPEIPVILYREAMMVHLLLLGNSYSEIVRDNSNRVKELWLLTPNRVTPKRKDGGVLYYEVITPDGATINFSRNKILHIPGLGYNGLTGMSPLDYHREAIGLGLSTQEYGARFFENNARPSGVLQHPGKLSNDAGMRLRESWETAHKGLKNSHRIAILEEGLQFKEISISQEAAQYLQTRRFQLEEICRIYRVPPHMIAAVDKAFTNIEQQSLEFVVHCIRPWLARLEQVFNFSLLTTSGLKGLFYEHVIDGLLRGDIQSRYQAYSIGRQQGWLSVNEIRSLENMNTIDDGDIYLQPLNMVEAGKQQEVNPDVIKNVGDVKGTFEKKSETRSYFGDATETPFKKKLQNIFQVIVDDEVKAISESSEKNLSERSMQNFRDFLEGFYDNHKDYVRSKLSPIIEAHANELYHQASRMIGVDDIALSPEFETFASDYLEKLAFRYCNKGKAELASIIEKIPKEEIKTAIETRIGEWATGRAEKMAADESVRIQNACARETWKQHGIKKLKWVSGTGKGSCPFCKRINGKTVSIEKNFFEANDVIYSKPDNPITDTSDPNYGKGYMAMKIYSSKKHPPIHKGCRCTIAPA